MVPGELIFTLRTAFEDYAPIFKNAPYNSDSTVEKTLLHINKVVENILILADSLELSENEKHVAEITAQFHDIGRLWLLLPENADSKIIDHADASIEYLKASPIFGELDEATQNIAIQVIKTHNQPELPKKDKEGEAILFLSLIHISEPTRLGMIS